jgi:hypothetical protein
VQLPVRPAAAPVHATAAGAGADQCRRQVGSRTCCCSFLSLPRSTWFSCQILLRCTWCIGVHSVELTIGAPTERLSEYHATDGPSGLGVSSIYPAANTQCHDLCNNHKTMTL